jgi:hypothetical protein
MPAAKAILYGRARPSISRAGLDNRRAPIYTGEESRRLPRRWAWAARSDGGRFVSIVRIGLGENKKFGAGYEAIFGKKKDKKEEKDESAAKDGAGKKKKRAKKK